jgi:isoamylase
MQEWEAVEGAPFPFGATWIAEQEAYNFALYSKHATGVLLLLYAPGDVLRPCFEFRFDRLKNRSGRVWHCRIPKAEMNGAKYYAYRVEGPFDPAQGHRFDPQKVLFDPYARALYFPPTFDRSAAIGPGDNAGKAPLGVIDPPGVPNHKGAEPWPRHGHDLVIYEMHVRGFTRRENSGVRPLKRGTYGGVIEKIPYLKELGVTAVELMPIHQFDPQEGNYWGYMTLNFFAPHQGYSSYDEPGLQSAEFRAMVRALHDAGIEVLLDVVYNHTGEYGDGGPTYSYRGIDNTTYYLLHANDLSKYRNDAGTGNVFHCSNRDVRKLILDSMHFWVNEMKVDGFRFDLASIFTRNSDGTVNLDDPPIISQISADPAFAGLHMIAEAWDLAAYQLGRNFPGLTWLQWNGQFRDDLRSFVRGDAAKVTQLMRRLYGSDDLFPDDPPHCYRPYQSVNFVTAHDGFCLYDLVSYNQKHNEANGENNRDGTDHNLSWNCGWEGDVDVPPQVLALRRRQVKNFCCLLLLANGTPMFCAGDEFMNTQKGNNNPFNQDNETTWLDWSLLGKNQDVFRFFRLMIAFRKAHCSIGRSRFWREDVRWYGTTGVVDTSPLSRTLAYCLHGASQGDTDLYVMINGWKEPVEFRVQEGRPGDWLRVVDTSRPSPEDILDAGSEVPLRRAAYPVGGRSVVVLVRRKAESGG